jgi:DnaJ-class molecular chaperone
MSDEERLTQFEAGSGVGSSPGTQRRDDMYIGQATCEHCNGRGTVAAVGGMRSCAAVGSYVEANCEECGGYGEHGVWADEEVAAEEAATVVTAVFVVAA